MSIQSNIHNKNSLNNNFVETGATGHTIILFYKYIGIKDVAALIDRERAVCELLGLKGRMLVSVEGINATLEGKTDNIEQYITHILKDPRFKDMNIKRSEGTVNGNAFPRLSIRPKKEIVSTGLPEHIAPEKFRAPYIQPYELRQKYERGDDFIIIDMRNDYELAVGQFDKTLNIGLENSRDLVAATEKIKYKIHPDTDIITVCTGGVRCEKMAAYLIDQGFKNVKQLHNGMHAYMEKYPGLDFQGGLYTFDNRKVMHWGGDNRKVIGQCKFCQTPSERYENCANNLCHSHYIVCDDCVEARGLYCGDCK